MTLSDTLRTCEADDHFNATADKPVVARYSIVTCAMAPANWGVLHFSLICNMCGVTLWNVWHRADARAMAPDNSCVLCHSLMCNMCGMTFWYLLHRTHACAMALSNLYVFTRLVHAQYVRRHALICVASRKCTCYGAFQFICVYATCSRAICAASLIDMCRIAQMPLLRLLQLIEKDYFCWRIVQTYNVGVHFTIYPIACVYESWYSLICVATLIYIRVDKLIDDRLIDW